MKSIIPLLLGTALLGTGPVLADNVQGVDLMLCASVEAQVCLEGSECKPFHTDSLDIPRFIIVDAEAGTLSTTEASGLNRQSAADNVRRADGYLILQGFERDRAYSFYVEELTGLATFSASETGRSITVFGACTPADND
jgi:hypothetical protein